MNVHIFVIFVFGIGSTLAWDRNNVELIREKLMKNVRSDLPAELEYIDEILSGHKKIETDKYREQANCMCVAHFIDPHCGSDMTEYDNGCFFLCAQKKNPKLRLKRWGSCYEGFREIQV